MHPKIEAFLSSWDHVRGMTYDFARAVPDDRWEFSPHAGCGPFHKTLRHMVCVQGVYLGVLTGAPRAPDWGSKHSHYTGPLERDALLAALREKDRDLSSALAGLDADAWRVDWYGHTIDVARFLHVLIQHESLHHGEWSLYAKLGGFESPPSWKVNWGL